MGVPKRASEELLAAPLPTMIKDLGLAVAAANKALKEGNTGMEYAIPEAEIELNIAIAITNETETNVGMEVGFNAFSVNASYANTFSFNEEASSRIRLTLRAVQTGQVGVGTADPAKPNKPGGDK